MSSASNPNKEENVSNTTSGEVVTVEEQEEFLQVIRQLNIASNAQKKEKRQRRQNEYKFWRTQPVPSITEYPTEHGAIDVPKTVEDVRQEPYNMPDGFQWSEIDFQNIIERDEVYDLLALNYVEDDDSTLRFDYSREFLQWALTPPGYLKEWHVAVRNVKTNKLMAFISAIPVTTRVYTNTMPMAEVNFLCVHKKLRTKRLAPVLIKEITRRVNLKNIWQAIYTAGVVLPMPVAQCRYYHRSLNPKKLVSIGFSQLPPRMTITGMIKALKVPPRPTTEGFRRMELEDVPKVTALFKKHLETLQLVVEFTEEEVAHWLLPRDGVMYSYVVEQESTKKITDFCSFYNLPSSILGHEKYKTLRAAYAYYNIATSMSLVQLMKEALVVAKQQGFDVFNALTIAHNKEFLEKLKFGAGTGELHYYLYNWRCPRMQDSQVGVLLC